MRRIIAALAFPRKDRPDFPFWPMLFDNITIRLLGSDDFPVEARQQAAADLTAAAANDDLEIRVRNPLPQNIAQAHEQVDADNRRRVLVAVRGVCGRRR